jgi:conjugal transfer pilus assembly protein TrbC
MKRAIGLAIMFAIALEAGAEDVRRDTTREALDRAAEYAREAAKARRPGDGGPTPNGTTPIGGRIAIDRVSDIDPLAIAERYGTAVGRSNKEEEQKDLLVFVSLSMPMATLERLANQVRRVGGALVFRGVKGGLRNKGYRAMMDELKPLAETGVSMLIDPEAFRRYGVEAVPTFVVSGRAGCGSTACPNDALAVVGDVSLDYALEHIAGGRTDAERLATRLLRQVRGRE